MMTATYPKLFWEWGTAYDMFVSLEVLHNPSKFGVRSSWASSVRKRIPDKDQEILELGQHLYGIPFHWLQSLPSPKDAITVLYTLQQIPASKRIDQLALCCEEELEWADILMNPAERPLHPDSIVRSVSIRYPDRPGLVSGSNRWFACFFVVSIAFAFILKPLVKVRL